jgi:hypothetical protein
MMSTKMPPVPPENRSDKGPGSKPDVPGRKAGPEPDRQKDPDQTGQAGNTKINTTHQGYQQDR